ncbi:MAG: 6-phosphofructokinase [Phototrophicaceae bacterium]
MKLLCVVSGGDAPGINAVLTQLAQLNGGELLGAVGGFPGLLAGQVQRWSHTQLVAWMGRGGSLLPSSREAVLNQADAAQRVQAVLADHQVDGLVVFGGNGTLRYIPPLLQAWGIPFIGIPTTIDNDVPGVSPSLGFDSACNYACQAIDGILSTASALGGRLFLLETLGGGNGNIALAVAEAAHAHAVVLPEYDYDDQALANRLKQAVARDGYGLLVINEYARGARTLADELPERTGTRVRDVRLGHAQRGATPSHQDRILAVRLAQAAYAALSRRESGILVTAGNGITRHDGALPDSPVLPDRALYERINGL